MYVKNRYLIQTSLKSSKNAEEKPITLNENMDIKKVMYFYSTRIVDNHNTFLN
jgi:hypothetical protein